MSKVAKHSRTQTNPTGQDMNMKGFIVISVAVFMSFGSAVSNAAKCKWLVDTVSYSTGEPVRWTRWIRNRTFLTNPYAAIAGISEGEGKYLGLQVIGVEQAVTTRPTKDELDAAFIVRAGSTLSILMADDSIYELVATEDIIGDADFTAHGPNSYTINAFAIVKFPLDADAIAALTAQRASDMRLQANGKDYDFSFGKKPVDKIQKTIVCIQ